MIFTARSELVDASSVRTNTVKRIVTAAIRRYVATPINVLIIIAKDALRNGIV